MEGAGGGGGGVVVSHLPRGGGGVAWEVKNVPDIQKKFLDIS